MAITNAPRPRDCRTIDRCDCAFIIANLIQASPVRAGKTKSRRLTVCTADVRTAAMLGVPLWTFDVASDAFGSMDAIPAPPTAKPWRAISRLMRTIDVAGVCRGGAGVLNIRDEPFAWRALLKRRRRTPKKIASCRRRRQRAGIFQMRRMSLQRLRTDDGIRGFAPSLQNTG
ncbi:MAG: hypothetical protein HYS63_05270 [Methylocystis sp.]|nr:hypothetical protein [Methylocystis sp.]